MSILSFDETEESGYDVRPRRDAEAGTGPLYIVCSPRRTVGKTLLARLLAGKEDKDLFGQTEFDVRGLALRMGAKAYEERLREKKMATKDRA